MSEEKRCFIIMPIADMEEYSPGHFNDVYQDIIKPAVEVSGYLPCRADDTKKAHIIHADIIKQIIECPLAICDVSGRNPNVLFELGIRQAFDKPVVILKDKCTSSIFDISLIRYVEYSSDMKYKDVIKTQQDLKIAIDQTMDPNSQESDVNSLIKLAMLSSPAKIPALNQKNKENISIELLRRDVSDLKKIILNMNSREVSNVDDESINLNNNNEENLRSLYVYDEMLNQIEDGLKNNYIPDIDKNNIMKRLERIKHFASNYKCKSFIEYKKIKSIIKRIKDAESNIMP